MLSRGGFLSQRVRQSVLTAHVMMSVGLLGDSAGFLAVAIRAATTKEPEAAIELVRVLKMFSLVFGLPLSIGTLVTDVTLSLGTKWGVFSYPWVIAKLVLVLSVMLVGGFFIGPAQTAMVEGNGDATRQLIAATSYDVLALALATALSVFKPGRPLRRATL